MQPALLQGCKRPQLFMFGMTNACRKLCGRGNCIRLKGWFRCWAQIMELYKRTYGSACTLHVQEAVWERWLQQAEGIVMVPGTENGIYNLHPYEQEQSMKACKLEHSIHRSTVRKQHMFRVSPLGSPPPA